MKRAVLMSSLLLAACGQSSEPGALYQADAHGNLAKVVQAPAQVIVQQQPVVQPQPQVAAAPVQQVAVQPAVAQAPQQQAPAQSDSGVGTAVAAGVAGLAVGAMAANALSDKDERRQYPVSAPAASAPPSPTYRTPATPTTLPPKAVSAAPDKKPSVATPLTAKLSATQPKPTGYSAPKTQVAAQPKISSYSFKGSAPSKK